MPSRRPVTLAQVAAEAGVSVATASRAFNGSSRTVGTELAERVLEAARRLDYSPNTQAQAMVKGQSNTIGLLVTDIADPYFSAIASGVSRAASGRGMVTLLGTADATGGDGDRRDAWSDYLRTMRGHRVRAAILVGSMQRGTWRRDAISAAVESFEAAGGRVVVISQATLPVDTVVVQNRSAAKDLATRLAERGYRRFAVLAGPADLLTARDRTQGFRDGVRAGGAPDPVLVHGAFTRDGGYAAMTELLDLDTDVDCVLAVNDVMAVGAMAACRDRGVSVPDRLAMAGFDDIPTLRDVTPALTTVGLPLEHMGELALELVLDHQSGAPRRRVVRGEVLLRESTPARS